MSTDTRLTIAIVSYKSYDVICTCLSELVDSNAFPVVIVDNASPDGASEKLRSRFPNANVIRAAQNVGYGRAANLALKACTSPYLLLINPDLKASSVAVRQLFQRMLETSGSVTLLAPAVATKDFLKQGLVDRKWVIGAAMMFDVMRLREVGFFDENIFLFAEETDLCQRLRAAGHRIVLDSDIYIEHLYRQSSAPDPGIEYLKDWHFAWSRMYYYNKHGLANGKKSPYRLLTKYLVKYMFATNAAKRSRYKARVLGALAFMRGEHAFLADGTPQCLPAKRA